MNFEDVPIREFIKAYSQSTGKNYVVASDVSGSVSVVSNDELTFGQAEIAFKQILTINGLTLRQMDGFETIVRLEGPRRFRELGETATLVFAVEPSAANGIVETVSTFMPESARVVLLGQGGVGLIVVERSLVGTAQDIVSQVRDATDREVTVFKLKHANASEVVNVINNIGILDNEARIAKESKSNSIIVAASQRTTNKVSDVINSLDSSSSQIESRVYEITHSDPVEIADIVQLSFGTDAQNSGIRMVANEETSTIFVRAPKSLMPEIDRSIRALDRQSDQVLIEAVVFELAVEDFSDISVQFGGSLSGIIAGGIQFSGSSQPPLASMVSALFSGSIPTAASGASLGVLEQRRNGDILGALLGALATKASSNIIATPSILTLNNQRAEMVVAQNVPFVTGSYTSVGDTNNPSTPFQTISRQDVGLVLRVRPRISKSRQVRLEIEQEISNLTGSASAAGGEITSRRSLTTTVLVGDRDVAILGGLLEESNSDNSAGVPKLSELPLLGALFSADTVNQNKRVLLLMIRPQVITDPIELARVTSQFTEIHGRNSVEVNGTDIGGFIALRDRSVSAYYKRNFNTSFIDQTGIQWPPLPPRIPLEVLLEAR